MAELPSIIREARDVQKTLNPTDAASFSASLALWRGSRSHCCRQRRAGADSRCYPAYGTLHGHTTHRSGVGTASAILAAQWAALGGLLLFGGVTQTRAVEIFAADFLIIAGLAGAIACLFTQASLTAIITQGMIAALGLLTSSLSRLTDKADLKRELVMMREQANHEREPASPTPPLRELEGSARSGPHRNADQTSGANLADVQTSHGATDGY